MQTNWQETIQDPHSEFPEAEQLHPEGKMLYWIGRGMTERS